MHGVVFLGESLFRPVQTLIDSRYRTAEHFGDFTVRNTLPRCQFEDFAVAKAKAGCRLEHSLVLGALDHDGFRTWDVATGDRGCSGDHSPEPMNTSPPPIDHTLGDDKKPRTSCVAAGHIVDSPPSDLKDIVGRVLAIGGWAAAHAVGEDIGKMLPIQLVKPMVRCGPHDLHPQITQA